MPLLRFQPARRWPNPGGAWPFDEVFPRIQDKARHPWRTVDQRGHAPDLLMRSRRKALPGVEHRPSKHLNTRAEASHRPT